MKRGDRVDAGAANPHHKSVKTTLALCGIGRLIHGCV